MKPANESDTGSDPSTSESLLFGTYIPVDAVLLFGYLLIADLVLYSTPADAIVPRAVVGFPLLFFIPGYVLVGVLFPGRRRDDRRPTNWRDIVGVSTDGRGGLDWPERLAVSFGTSVALLPLFGLLISVLGLAYSANTVVMATTVFAVVGTVVSIISRSRLQPDERFGLPVDQWVATVESGLFRQRSALDVVLNVSVALVVLVSVAGVGYALVAPNHSESFTTVSLLTETDDGEFVAAGYPDTIDAAGEELVLEIGNNEREEVTYTVVVELQRVETAGTSTTVIDRRELKRTSQRTPAGETWTYRHRVRPAISGEDLRLIYYVYRGDAPENPDTESAYRHVNIWVDAA